MTRIVYIHVPKCGGSSFGAALRARYLWSQATIRLGQGDPALRGEARILDDYRQRSAQLHRLIQRRVRIISGHVQYDGALHRNAASDWAFVTLLRDPVERFVSHFNYLQRHHPDPQRAPDLDRFVETEDARRIASQYLFYFGGESLTMTQEPNTAETRAITALLRFDVVGDLARPAQFAHDLRKLTGGVLPVIRRNVAPAQTKIPSHLRTRIEALCASDMRIYHSVLSARLAA
jgi:hypothetical protein